MSKNIIKIGHISDTHLGYSSGKKIVNGVNLREQDGYDAWHLIINEMIEQKIDFVVHTGDLFHWPNPSIKAINEALIGLRKLADAGIKFYGLAGNHDATDVVSQLSANKILNLPEIGIHCFGEPYEKVKPVEGLFLHMVSHHGYMAQEETFKNIKKVDNAINILLTHGSCYDDNLGLMLKTELAPREVVIPQELIEMDWDYTLLGHIHERGWVHSKDGLTDTAKRKQFYGGSTIRRGFADKECKLDRGWTLWEVNLDTKEFTPNIIKIPQRAQFDFVIDCKNKDITQIDNEIRENLKQANEAEHPLVRITFNDLPTELRLSLSMSQYTDYTRDFLSFSTKFVSNSKTNESDNEKVFSTDSFSYDLFSAFDSYWDDNKDNIEKEIQEKTKENSDKYLSEGNSKVLEKQ